jgi:two-component system, OmpR family, sensor histidine kinase KdpD
MEATVSGLLDEGEPSPERVREELGALIVDLSRLNRSIGELLDLSRLESDEWRPTRDWHDLGDVVGSVVGALAARDRSRIVLDLPEEPVITYVDFVQVSRAVHHVVENALAYSAENERVVVSVGRSDTASFITVTDRGPGVPSTEQTRIFEKFYRGGSSSRVPHGTGLGLAISSEIMGRHGGTIRVEQARPQGARFVLEFPDGERPERGVVPLEEESV